MIVPSQAYAFELKLHQHNGVDGNWRPADGDAPASSAGAPAACSECKLLRHEVQQLKSCIQTIFLVLSQNGVVGATSPVLGALSAAPTLPTVQPPPPTQSLGSTRKRPAPPPPPPQPECPVALRPITSCPTLSSPFMPHWTWLMPGLMRPPSPTLPAPPSLEATSTTQQEHEPTKWSNPSSVESNGLKNDHTAGEPTSIDIVGMDGSESSTSSTSTQAMLTSPAGQAQLPAYLKDPHHPIFPFPQKSADLSQSSFLYGMVKTEPPASRSAPVAASMPIGHVHSITTPERKHRKQQNDDYVKLIREQDLSDERISAIPIPVPQALSLDPNFRAVSEQQVVQQVIQNKRFEEVDVRESMTHLCKKLAEKRVFGSKLMAETTVAGLNHSTFPNLPIEGIMYIQHVCRKVLGDRFSSDDDFWESLRDSMRKLAARCRRVRHAKKTKSSREESVLLPSERSCVWPEGSVAQTLQSLNLPTEKPTHSVQTIPIVPDRKKQVADISDVKLAETLQNGLHALATATLGNQALPATLAEMSSAWSLLQLHKNTEPLLQQRDLRSDDISSP
ncbi:unnamed protein product [Cylicocyclus nassatus]|uniref:Uncharacterized protein n=1 Tax=Cylicocyclus nassatus TaxID=53992 RepID=A0AA36HE02_CYLNA|nr:unnamed protein product [Cylicocyclus nassatus]